MDKRLTIFAIFGIVFFIILYGYSFPSLDQNIEINSKEAKRISDNFLRSMNQDPNNYISSTILLNDQHTRTFIETTLGFNEMENLTKSKIPTLKWSTIYYKELELEFIKVDLTTDGRLLSYHHKINQTLQGANLTQEEALKLSKEFLKENGINITNYELIDQSTKEKPNRVDHLFKWKQENFSIPYKSSNATLDIGVGITGDEVNLFFRKSLDIPEEYLFDEEKIFSKMIVFGLISILITLIIYVAAIIIFAKQYNYINKKLTFIIGAIIGLISIIGTINSFPLISYSYTTNSSLFVYYTTVSIISLISAFFSFIGTFIITGSGQALCKKMYPHTVKIFDRIRNYSIKEDITNGYLLAGIFLGYLALFYAIGKLFFDTWTPVQLNNPETFNVLFPFILPLTIALTAAITEEFLYRMFAIPLVEKITKRKWLALLIPAIIWAFGHSAYAVSPFYLRFIELTIVGILFGIFFLRYGIVSVVVAHYTINATLISIPLLVSSSPYYIISGIIAIGLAFMPALFNFNFNKKSKNSAEGF